MDMESTLRANLMRYAASRQMFCPDCGDILDCENNLVYCHATSPRLEGNLSIPGNGDLYQMFRQGREERATG